MFIIGNKLVKLYEMLNLVKVLKKFNIFFDFRNLIYIYRSMGIEFKIKDEEIKIKINKKVKKRYQDYCLEHGVDMSKDLREYIEKVLEIEEI